MSAIVRQGPPGPDGYLADVALLLEGTYPYVSGGVSSWVHQLIEGLPELRFAVVFLGGTREQYGEARYPLPRNLVHLERHFLMEPPGLLGHRLVRGDAAAFAASQRLHQHLRAGEQVSPALFLRAVAGLGQAGGVTLPEFLGSQAAWEAICTDYRARCSDPSFVDYFWSVRVMHAPLFRLAAIARGLPPCRAYHAVSTGYAGLLGAMLRHRHRRPFVLTEHGIYTKERKIDLAQAPWIHDPPGEIGYLRRLWIRFFEGLGRLAYQSADPILSLYEGNRRRQIADGAAAARTRVVPNGIDLARFAPLRAERPPEPPPRLGLLGRVVPIKDVKTFVRALRLVLASRPDAEGWVIGPTDEDPGYARECQELAQGLGLGARLRFLGFRRPEEVLPQLGLLVLTSISEALPLSLLEGFASGLPALATDVGACRELIEGGSAEDQALGAAGAVVHISDPEATARAALALLGDPAAWRLAQRAGVRRVEAHYTAAAMLGAYRAIYQRAVQAPTEAG